MTVPVPDPAVYYHKTLDDVVAESVTFVDSLDRSILGSFAISREVLIALDTHERVFSLAVLATISVAESEGISIMSPVSQTFNNAVDIYLDHGGSDAEESFENASFELLWWWSVSAEPMWKDSYRLRGTSKRKKEFMARFDFISTHQNMLSFFEADIWDTALIQGYLDNNIDASLASALLLT